MCVCVCVSVKWLGPVTPNGAQETIAPAATHQAQALHIKHCFTCLKNFLLNYHDPAGIYTPEV